MESLPHRLGGQILAINVLLRALIETHPNRRALQEDFELKRQVAIAALTPLSISEEVMEGFEEQTVRMWKGLEVR